MSSLRKAGTHTPCPLDRLRRMGPGKPKSGLPDFGHFFDDQVGASPTWCGRNDTEVFRRRSGAADMQIGVIGLGRMGANIVRRLQRGRHECVAYDADPSVAQRLAAEGLPATRSLSDFLKQLTAPRAVWV